jgi:hypothetical protein
MRRIEDLLNKIYDRNPDNGNYKIEVSLNNYAEIFNDWDHAPFKRKDIDPELLVFLEHSIDDIPMKYAVDICFYITDEVQDKGREKLIVDWFKTFYEFYIEIEKSKARSKVKRSAVYLLIAVFLLTLSFFGIISRSDILAYTLTEIIVVGGWVFLWEAISQITFQRQFNSKLIKNYRRFKQAGIIFRYSKPPANGGTGMN